METIKCNECGSEDIVDDEEEAEFDQQNAKVSINDIIKDNDPRVGHRLLVIESFDDENHVRARRIFADGTRSAYPKKGFRISLTRIHTDGKKRRGGFALERDHPLTASHELP